MFFIKKYIKITYFFIFNISVLNDKKKIKDILNVFFYRVTVEFCKKTQNSVKKGIKTSHAHEYWTHHRT